MKIPKCPYCGKKVQRTIGVGIRGRTTYFLNRARPGYVWIDDDNGWEEISKWKKKTILGFYCRHCGREFPHEMDFEIRKYLKQDSLLQKLVKKT